MSIPPVDFGLPPPPLTAPALPPPPPGPPPILPPAGIPPPLPNAMQVTNILPPGVLKLPPPGLQDLPPPGIKPHDLSQPALCSSKMPHPGMHLDVAPHGMHPFELPGPRVSRLDVGPPGMHLFDMPRASRLHMPPRVSQLDMPPPRHSLPPPGYVTPIQLDAYGQPQNTFVPPPFHDYPPPPPQGEYYPAPAQDRFAYPPYLPTPDPYLNENRGKSVFEYYGVNPEFYSSKHLKSYASSNREWDLRRSERGESPTKYRSSSGYYDRECSSSRYENRERDRSRVRYRDSRDRYESRDRSRERSRNRDRYESRERSRYRSRERDSYDSRASRQRSRESDRYESRDRYKERYYREKYARCGRKSPQGHHSHDRYSRSSSRRGSPSRESMSRSHHSRETSSRSERKPMTDREKILEEFRKNYCGTADDFVEKVEQWAKENPDEEEGSKLWYRSSPAELYYKRLEGRPGVQQTKKLEALVDTFFKELIERGRKARPELDEMPPLPTRSKPCPGHNLHAMDISSDDEESISSGESSEDILSDDEDNLESDRIVQELQRKQNHPRRLHAEMWFNNAGEMNSGPLCRCSARARRFGMRHGVYAGEQCFPKCVPGESNVDKLYHYRITVSPPTNFLIKAPTIIAHDEHEFLFSGFSMFSHYKLAKLPTCKVIRFNIEYTILYVEEPAPENYTVQELDMFQEFIFTELLELVDLDLGRATETSCSQFHFMPRFVRYLPEGGCEVLSMSEVMRYLVDQSGLLIPPEKLEEYHKMDHYYWQKFVDNIKGMIVTYPGKKPCSVRVDQLDRSPPAAVHNKLEYYPEIVHFGIRPPQLSYAGSPEYQKRWRFYVKLRHLIANMAKPTYNDRRRLAAREAKLQEMRTQSKMKRDVTVAISSEGFHRTGLMCDVVQHAMLIPVLIRHLRFHKSLDNLEEKIGYVFQQRTLLQTALTHPSYRENFGTNPDHARNSLTNCGIRQPEYGDRRIHYTRKKGIVTLINIMSRFGKNSETESEIKHNERLEFLGDAVVEFISSIHLFRMFPALAEGGLATYRASIVQNQHLAHLAKNIELEKYMLYAHGSDLCREVVMKHAMANCFEALMGALFLDAGLQVADRVFAISLWHEHPELYDTWMKERSHPLQDQEPLGDRKYIKDFEFLQKLTEFEKNINVEFKHIRLLARAFTDRSVGFTHLTLGSNQRLEFLGDTVLQLVVSDRLYRHFPDHHEGHLSLLRSSLVNNRTQSMVCDDLNLSEYAIYNNPKSKPTTKKHKADLLEAFLGALFIDRGLRHCQAFCNACLFPRLQEFIMNQDWNDPKSKLQQCCLTLRSMEGGEPDIPLYKVIECLGPTNTRVYTVGVYFRGTRLASAKGHSIQEAEMHAAEMALSCAHELFPQLDHQKRVIAKSTSKRKRAEARKGGNICMPINYDKVPKAYRIGEAHDSESSDQDVHASDNDGDLPDDKSDDDSGLDSDAASLSPKKLESIEVSSLLSDMEKIKADMIVKNEYDKLKEKSRRSDSED